MTQEGWVSSIALALIGGFVAGIGTDTDHKKACWAVGAAFVAPVMIRLWILAIVG